MMRHPSRARRLLPTASGAVVLLALATAGPLTAQRPAGRSPRPAILEVSGESLARLDPVAKLRKERKHLALTDPQAATLDSLAVALGREVAPFLVRVDSLQEVLRGAERELRRPGGSRPAWADAADEDPLRHPFMRLWNAVAQVKLRYEAAYLSAARVLTDEQRARAAELVKKDQAKLEELTMSRAFLGRP